MSAKEIPVRSLVGVGGYLAGMDLGEPIRAPSPTRAVVHDLSFRESMGWIRLTTGSRKAPQAASLRCQ
jgi:hypothetical protein